MYFSTIYLVLLSSLHLASPSPFSPPPAKRQQLDTNSTQWQTLAPIPTYPRQEHTTVFLPPSTIVILGGIIPANDTTVFPPVLTTPIMQFYSIPNNTWTTPNATSPAPMPHALNHLNAAVVDDKIYVLGGMQETNTPSLGRAWRGTPSSYMYDPEADTWTPLPAGLAAADETRGSAAVGVYNATIFLAGGVTDLEFYGNASQRSVRAVSAFDTVSRSWVALPEKARNLPEARDHAGAAVVGSKMYILGGRAFGQENVKDTVFVLDLEDLAAGWRTSSARMPTARGGVSTGVVGTKVYTLGGEGNVGSESGVFNEVEVFDTVDECWEAVDEGMKVPRHGTYAVGVGDRVYVPGGGIMQSGAPVDDFDVFVV
ncbi:unnamed protein product [Periconia digitata]|uniref:Galactose oxidase n=1 Tax=Periconia digitata TaxID=1303443 RepID=A0A9W4U781_9PLEO|nr:unnamed protein product [Periconia digitata]